MVLLNCANLYAEQLKVHGMNMEHWKVQGRIEA